MICVDDPGSERGHERERKHQAWECQENISEAHQRAIDPASKIAGRSANEQPDRPDRDDHQQHDRQRHTRTMDDAAEDVASECVGAEPRGSRGRSAGAGRGFVRSGRGWQ